MTAYVHRNGKVVEKGGPEDIRQSSSNAPYIQSDYLQPMIHPVTGKMMDSKSQFRAVTKSRGYEEVGNEKQRDRREFDTPGLKGDIARAISELGG